MNAERGVTGAAVKQIIMSKGTCSMFFNMLLESPEMAMLQMYMLEVVLMAGLLTTVTKIKRLPVKPSKMIAFKGSYVSSLSNMKN